MAHDDFGLQYGHKVGEEFAFLRNQFGELQREVLTICSEDRSVLLENHSIQEFLRAEGLVEGTPEFDVAVEKTMEELKVDARTIRG